MRELATQERQAEKEKIKEQKSKFMQEMARKLYIMQQVYEKKIEPQRQGFQIKLK